MHSGTYTIEDSKLYIALPISFTKTILVIHMTDGGNARAAFGARILSTNKFQAFNIGWGPKGSFEAENVSSYVPYVSTLGF
jgi:hypothetical protein